MSDISNIDISATYKGFRLQAIFILHTVLRRDCGCYYIPENVEDLTIIDKNGKTTTLIQVKSSSGNIYLSTFEPHKKDGFFRRVERSITQNNDVNIQVECFAAISSELVEAFNNGHIEAQKGIRKKLREANFSDRVIDEFFKKIQFNPQEEFAIIEEIKEIIQTTIGGGKLDVTIDLLTKWIYDLSEKKESFTKSSLVNQIRHIGEFLKDLKANYSAWFTYIKPFTEFTTDNADKKAFEEAFFEGVNTTFEHILFDLDVIRKRQLNIVSKGFADKNIVFVHGASGQGKTTLALRYIKEYHPLNFAFYIKKIPDFEASIDISRALLGYAEKLGIPILIYYDVNTHDPDWINILRELANRKNIKLLITIREENWRLSDIDYHLFPFRDIELYFGEDEANELYQNVIKKYTISNVLNFKDSWDSFGRKGPLLEYVYFLKKTATLKSRLKKQLLELEKRRSSQVLEFLAIISLITKYGSRVNLKKILLISQQDTRLSMLYELEKEYLIKIVDNPRGGLIESMHPIRSNTIYEILFDEGIFDWLDYIKKAVVVCESRDLQFFLLNIVHDKFDSLDKFFSILIGYDIKTWNELHAMYKALQWSDIKSYFLKNKDLITEVYGKYKKGWYIILDTNIAMIKSDSLRPFWKNFIKDNTQKEDLQFQYESFNHRLTPKANLFKLSRQLLEGISDFNLVIEDEVEWGKVAEIIFLCYHFDIPSHLEYFIEHTNYESFLSLPVNILAKLILAFFESRNQFFIDWYNINKVRLIEKYKKELKVDRISENCNEIKLEYFWRGLPVENDDMDNSDGHSENIKKIKILRELVPDKEFYASYAYGQVKITHFQPDDYNKRINKNIIHPKYLPEINSIFIGICNYHFRLNDWYDYCQLIKSKRKNIVESIEGFIKQFKTYFSLNQINNKKFIEETLQYFEKLEQSLAHDILLPRTAVDQFGNNYEGKDFSVEINDTSENQQEKDGILRSKFEFSKKSSDYFTYLEFFRQKSINIFLHHSINEKGNRRLFTNLSEIQKIMTDDPAHFIHLSLMNLKDAYKHLLEYQISFIQLFKHYIEADIEYMALIESEIKCFRVFLPVWFYFSRHPAKRVLSALWLKENYIDQFLSIQAKMLKKSLQRCATHYFEIKESINTKVDDDPSLLFHCQLKTSNNIDNFWKLIEHAVFNFFKDFSYTTLDFYIMDIFRRQFVFWITYENPAMQDFILKITLHDIKEKQSISENIFLRVIPLEKINKTLCLNKTPRLENALLNLSEDIKTRLINLIFIFEHFEKTMEFPFDKEITDYDYMKKLLNKLGSSFKELFSVIENFKEKCSLDNIPVPQSLIEFRDFFSSRADKEGSSVFTIGNSDFGEIKTLALNLAQELADYIPGQLAKTLYKNSD